MDPLGSANEKRKLPVLLFDIMDTIVRDPFYEDVPAFFVYPLDFGLLYFRALFAIYVDFLGNYRFWVNQMELFLVWGRGVFILEFG